MFGIYFLLFLITLNSYVCTAVSDSVKCPDVENNENVMFSFNSRCYQYVENVEEEVTYPNAAQVCNSRNGHLVTIKDNVTQVELVNNLQFVSDSHTILLGLKKVGNEWKWITGETLSYENWDSDSSCSGTCSCAKMKLASGGRWETYDCGSSDWYTVFLCEYGSTSKGCALMTGESLTLIVILYPALALVQLLKAGYL